MTVVFKGSHLSVAHFEYNFLGFHLELLKRGKLTTKYKLPNLPKFFNVQKYTNEDCLIQLIYEKESIHLLYIETHVRQKGLGSKYLDILCELADDLNIKMTLNVISMVDESKPYLSNKQLTRFYRSRGFRMGPLAEYERRPKPIR